MLNPFSHFIFEPEELHIVFAAEQIFKDYKDFVKSAVMPYIEHRYKIRMREMLTLICVDSAVQPISAKEVATIIRQDPATMSRSTVILIGRKYISTLRNVNDHREKILQITTEGKDVTKTFRKILAERFDKLKDFEMLYNARRSISEIDFNTIEPLQERARLLSKVSSNPAFCEFIE